HFRRVARRTAEGRGGVVGELRFGFFQRDRRRVGVDDEGHRRTRAGGVPGKRARLGGGGGVGVPAGLQRRRGRGRFPRTAPAPGGHGPRRFGGDCAFGFAARVDRDGHRGGVRRRAAERRRRVVGAQSGRVERDLGRRGVDREGLRRGRACVAGRVFLRGLRRI